jgi:hypothetical protein
VFTSQRDDEAGGDTNGDGVGSGPATGDWGRLLFRNSGTGTVSYVSFYWGGGGNATDDNVQNPAASAALEVQTTSAPQLDHLLVTRSQNRGALLNVTGGFDWTLSDSTFSLNSGRGLEITGNAAPIELGNINSDANASDGVVIAVSGPLDLTNLTVTNNGANGVILSTGGRVQLADSSITGHGGGTGLIISAARSDSTVRGNTISGANIVASVIPNVVQELVDNNTLSDTDRGLYVRPGTLTVTDTWVEPGFEYVINGDVVVAAGVTLTLDPGVVAKFKVTRSQYTDEADLIVDGALIAVGTIDDPIRLTSHRDDAYGGDTNGDGNATVPATGDWGRLLFRNNGNGSVSYVEIYWGGGGNATDDNVNNPAGSAAFEVSSPIAPSVDNLTVAASQSRGALFSLSGGFDWTLTDSTFRNNAGRGLEVSGGSGTLTIDNVLSNANGGDGILLSTTGPQTLSDLEITNNGANGFSGSSGGTFSLIDSIINNHSAGTAFVLSGGGVGAITGNTLSNANIVGSVIPNAVEALVDNNVLTQTDRGLHVRAGTLGVSSNWPAPGFEYAIDGNLTVAGGVTLTLDAGVVLKFKVTRSRHTDEADLIVDGVLLANGTGARPVSFTSMRDDVVGGDTNGDGAASGPATGDWGRVFLRDGSSATLASVEISWGGGGNSTVDNAQNPATDAALSVANATLDMDDGTIQHSQADGARIYSGSGTIDTTALNNNATWGIRFQGATCGNWTLTENTYAGNGSGDTSGCP